MSLGEQAQRPLTPMSGATPQMMQRLMETGGPVTARRGYTPKGIGDYHTGTDTVTVHPGVQGPMIDEVVRHELVHALQNRTIGMGANDPVDMAVRRRLGLSEDDPGMDRVLAENFAQYGGNREPLEDSGVLNMVMRSMSNRVFRPTNKKEKR